MSAECSKISSDLAASSSPAQVAPPNNQIAEDGPLADAAIAHKFSSMLGVPEPMLLEALPGLNRCFAKRLPGRKLYKPLDLWALTAFVEAADGTKLGGSGLRGRRRAEGRPRRWWRRRRRPGGAPGKWDSEPHKNQ